MEEWVKSTKEGKRLVKDTADAVFRDMREDLRRQGRPSNERDTTRPRPRH